MTVLTINRSDIGISQKVLLGFEKMFIAKTSDNKIRVSEEQSTTSKAMYAFNPFSKSIVEIDPNQAWFWKPEWLNSELAAEKELRAGDFEEFDNLDDFIDSL